MSLFKDFYTSQTIQPRYRPAHIVATLFLMEAVGGETGEKGIGRYRLEKEINLGAGSARSLFKQLSELGLIELVSKKAMKRGHRLSMRGASFLARIKEHLTFLLEGIPALGVAGEKLCLGTACFIAGAKAASERVANGMSIRDAAIKAGGEGATCLIVKESAIEFPQGAPLDEQTYPESAQYLREVIQEQGVERGDVLVIGTGQTAALAKIAAIEASLALFPELG